MSHNFNKNLLDTQQNSCQDPHETLLPENISSQQVQEITEKHEGEGKQSQEIISKLKLSSLPFCFFSEIS